MEAGDSGSRRSGPNSATSNNGPPDFYDQRPRDSLDRPYRPASSAMATAALISPSTPYHPHHSPYSAPYPPHSVPAMISPVESTRRASDDSEANSHRTSLPSIRDIISGKGQGGPPGSQTLPSPFSSQPSAPPPPPRSFAEPPPAREKPPSPRGLHPSSAYPRPESLPAFADPSRSVSGPRPGPPPLNIYPSQSPSGKPESAHEIDHRHHQAQEVPHMNGQYPPHHHPHPPHHPSQPPPPPPPSHSQSHSPYANGPPVPLPPGQLPLAAFPVSPRHHAGPSLHSPYGAQRPPLGPEDPEFARNRGKYDPQQLGRHYEVWNYADALAKIGSSSRQILSFAESYGKIAQEEQGPPPPGRLPTDGEIADMLMNCETITYMLEMVRGSVSQTILSQRMREGSRTRGFAEEEDINMFNDGMKQGYGATEVKKRRGRAAPPGRCHSCNRIDTPEWRRGPDGARTLCNACGLHYAKLERKRQMEQRGGRSKNGDERS